VVDEEELSSVATLLESSFPKNLAPGPAVAGALRREFAPTLGSGQCTPCRLPIQYLQKNGSSGRTRTYNPPVNSGAEPRRINNFAAQMTTIHNVKPAEQHSRCETLTQIDPRAELSTKTQSLLDCPLSGHNRLRRCYPFSEAKAFLRGSAIALEYVASASTGK